MAEIGFYHLTRSDLLDALPRLLGRTLQAGQRALVACAEPSRIPVLSAALWASTDPDWLPHGCEGEDDRPDRQPIWLAPAAVAPAPNGARFLFLTGGAVGSPGFDRVFDLFDGNDERQVALARQRWTAGRAAGDKLTYWQQDGRSWTARSG